MAASVVRPPTSPTATARVTVEVESGTCHTVPAASCLVTTQTFARSGDAMIPSALCGMSA